MYLVVIVVPDSVKNNPPLCSLLVIVVSQVKLRRQPMICQLMWETERPVGMVKCTRDENESKSHLPHELTNHHLTSQFNVWDLTMECRVGGYFVFLAATGLL